MHHLLEEFIAGMKATTLLEYIAVFAGIISVWLSKNEKVLLYPIGLVNTIIYIYLSFKMHLIGEASVNFYYTVVSIYGWYLWSRKDAQHHVLLHITVASKKEWMQHLLFFTGFYIVIFISLRFLKPYFSGAIPWADAFASATAYTGMWLMAKKKLENWLWWICTNMASIPLYFVKGLVFTSVYYIILLGLAIIGWVEWKYKRMPLQNAATFAIEHEE
ncbi:MAG: nicotinamide riboside transporter PnuC [Candidatus Dadabacteria bacterium]